MSKFRIQRSKQSISLTHGSSVTTASVAAPVGEYALNGILRGVVILTPAAVDGSATAKIQLIDSDGCTVYNTATGVAANSKSLDLLSTPVPLSGIATIQVTFSAAQTATDSTTGVGLLIERA